MKKFQETLKDRLKQVVGKEVSLCGSSNCVCVTLSSGTKYFGTISEIGPDFFTIQVGHTGGGKEGIAVNFKEVTSFSVND